MLYQFVDKVVSNLSGIVVLGCTCLACLAISMLSYQALSRMSFSAVARLSHLAASRLSCLAFSGMFEMFYWLSQSCHAFPSCLQGVLPVLPDSLWAILLGNCQTFFVGCLRVMMAWLGT